MCMCTSVAFPILRTLLKNPKSKQTANKHSLPLQITQVFQKNINNSQILTFLTELNKQPETKSSNTGLHHITHQEGRRQHHAAAGRRCGNFSPHCSGLLHETAEKHSALHQRFAYSESIIYRLLCVDSSLCYNDSMVNMLLSDDCNLHNSDFMESVETSLPTALRCYM